MKNKTSLDQVENLTFEKEESERIHYETYFSFLKQQNGIRPGKVHVFLAPPGSGKSTLVRSILHDMIKNFNLTERIVLWLSEERVLDFAIEFDRITPTPEFKFCIDVFSEMDSDMSDNQQKIYLDSLFNDDGNKIIVIDNITTSKFFADKKPDVQSKFLTYLKKKSIEKNVAVILIAHTTKTANGSQSLIRMEDTQGTSSTAKLAEFFFAIQSIYIKNTQVSILQVLKSRGQETPNKYFGLTFDKQSRIYKQDTILSHDEVKKIWKNRNSLG